MPSHWRRKRAAWLVLFFAVIGSLLRISRPDFNLLPILAPLDSHGTSTNFIVCAGMPFIAFWSKDVVSLSSYAKTAVGTWIGLSLYEIAQLFLPRRTFDPYDIVASLLGALLSILLASILFLSRRKNEAPVGQGTSLG